MKKRYFLAGALMCWGACFCKISGQTLAQAGNSYETFNKLRLQGASDTDVYTALLNCYKEYSSVLENAKVNTPEYVESKKKLREIYPFLQNGAAFFSSKGQQNNALVFARAFMDIPLMDAFAGDTFVRDDYFPTMAYFAASGTFNAGDYEKAIEYFRVYLDTGVEKNRQNVFAFMAKACINVKNYQLAIKVLKEGIANYPNDYGMLSLAINTCIDVDDNENMQEFVSKAMEIRPNDVTLLNIQGKLYEDTRKYQQALNVYLKLQELKPQNLNVVQHIALNYYNLGALNYNKAIMQSNENIARKYSRQANEYFAAAAETLKTIVSNDPNSVKYMQALAVAYSCMNDMAALSEINSRLSSIGAATVADNVTPSIINYDDKKAVKTQPAGKTTAGNGMDVTYSAFAKKFVERKLKVWQSKDPYETIDEYMVRVNENSRQEKVNALLKEAEKEYIDMYARNVKISDMTLKPYDAENKVFLVESKYGELIVPVPRENNEAKVFENSWEGMQLKDPEFYINDDKLALASITFVTPTGNEYKFQGDKSLNYVETVVDFNFDPLSDNMFIAEKSADAGAGKQTTGVKTIKMGKVKSDVDINIPVVSAESNKNTFAVIIANENYGMVASVDMALNDGETFGKYCEKTLGIPHKNIRIYKDASYGVMIRAMRDLKNISNAMNGDMKVIFYYAGHGIPDESTKNAFLLPVDSDGLQTEGCYSLSRLYGELASLDAESVLVFLDACFSGATREGNMLASARGVALKPKAETPKGNMVIFSAASDDETAFPYKEKGHGLFTYFLLKKIQETKGNVTLGELGEYVKSNVMKVSAVEINKPQTPVVTPSANLDARWTDIRLLP